MRVHELDIAGLKLENNVFLAPMAGYTNYPFRKMCRSLGAGLAFNEMVSAKALAFGSEESKRLLYTGGEESPKAMQLFGSVPVLMRAACESEELSKFDLIDINMGCPMPKIVRNGEGNALMEKPKLAEEIISECAKSGKRIAVKFRVGVKEGDRRAAEFAKLCEGAGACMITVHGRTRDKIYAGPVDYGQIEEAKAAVKIPVIANGGVWNDKDFRKMLDRTGADGVMIARAALYRPQVFAEITEREELSFAELFPVQLKETQELYGEHFACVFMRKMAAFYLKGRRGAAEWKRKLFAASSCEEVEKYAAEIFGNTEGTPVKTEK